MGFLGAKTKIYVSSTVYNMAGDQADRINFMKTTVNSSIIGKKNFSMSDTLTNVYSNGPGIQVRAFHRWAKLHYGGIGIPKINIMTAQGLDLTTIETHVPRLAGQIVKATYVSVGSGDPSYWAEQWIVDNRPQTDIALEWYCEYDGLANSITIFWPNLTTSVFTPLDFNKDDTYVYVVYSLKTSSSFLGTFMWIYHMGSGIGYLDNLIDADAETGEIVPPIPIRINNKTLSTINSPAIYALAKQAYKKATKSNRGKGFDDLIAKIMDNAQINDIDYAYMTYGVALNAKDNSARKYLFKFFDMLRLSQPYNAAAVAAWEAELADYDVASTAFTSAREAMLPGEEGGPNDPAVTGTIPVAPVTPVSKIEIKPPGAMDTNFKFVIKWTSIVKTTGTGLGKPGAKVGEVWWGSNNIRNITNTTVFMGTTIGTPTDMSDTTIYYQKTANSWERLKLTGVMHENFIYKTKEVRITAAEALLDTDESGFIVPLSIDIIKRMSIVDSTQMMTCGSYLVFNSYQIVKQKWYQTTLFKIFVFIVVIALVIAFPPAIGLLGPAASVGATLGFAGLAAITVGAIANALAAMILMAIISKVAVAAFGPKIGAIIAIIASVIALNVGTALSNGASLASMWGNLMSASNLLQLTSALGNAAGAYLRASAMDTMAKMQENQKEFEAESDRINNMMVKEFGIGDFHFDPTLLTSINFGGVGETPSMFLDRTLMTGSDIADLTLEMLHEFTTATLDLDSISG